MRIAILKSKAIEARPRLITNSATRELNRFGIVA